MHVATIRSRQRLRLQLSQEAFGSATRGDGEKGRSCSYEKYLYVIRGTILVAGRCGIVKDVLTCFTMETLRKGIR